MQFQFSKYLEKQITVLKASNSHGQSLLITKKVYIVTSMNWLSGQHLNVFQVIQQNRHNVYISHRDTEKCTKCVNPSKNTGSDNKNKSAGEGQDLEFLFLQ